MEAAPKSLLPLLLSGLESLYKDMKELISFFFDRFTFLPVHIVVTPYEYVVCCMFLRERCV
ncbi:TPA: hypothetical protein ACIBNT_004667, partial [Salmonella enterica subsp. enterica serovar Birkenhead]